MRTIPKKWPKDAVGDYIAKCDYCGMNWPRSKMRKDGAGLLVCPTHGDGLCTIELDQENREMARSAPWPFEEDSRSE